MAAMATMVALEASLVAQRAPVVVRMAPVVRMAASTVVVAVAVGSAPLAVKWEVGVAGASRVVGTRPTSGD